MRVYVVMGNDFPDAVFSTKEAAGEYCDRMQAREKNLPPKSRGRIHWRIYSFTLDRPAP